jgi:hypothetical protein
LHSRLNLTFARALWEPNTWRLDLVGTSLEARIRVASAAEVTLTIPLRRSAAKGRHDGRAFLRDLDGSTFLVCGGQYHDDLPRLELLLTKIPEHVLERLRAIP